MTDTITKQELNAWQEYLPGHFCPKHPSKIIKNGKYGLWCGTKTAFGWCDGGMPTDSWLAKYRKEKNEIL